MTLSDMAKTELGGHFKEAVLAWVDPVADPTKGLEQVNRRIFSAVHTVDYLAHRSVLYSNAVSRKQCFWKVTRTCAKYIV